MEKTMQAVVLRADWEPRSGFVLGNKDVEGKQTYSGSRVWRRPRVALEETEVPKPGPNEVLIEVKVCGICGSDVHMAQADAEGYILYPGLTGFPVVLGHEFAGVVVEAGPGARDNLTNRPFQGGETVCAEEMIWCGSCRPCAWGYPNHCERLDELGFNSHGALARYVVVPDRVVWNLDPLASRWEGISLFEAGSLVEPFSVAYNAVIQRGGGVKPGDNVVICGGGPVGLAACALLKRQGAAKVILSEPLPERAALGLASGADVVVNPQKEDLVQAVLELTRGFGAALFLESTGLPHVVYPQIEEIIWQGRTLGSTVVLVGRADAAMPVRGEVLQVRRAQIVGAQGHSGEGTFPRVIETMTSGLDPITLITKRIQLAEVPGALAGLALDPRECKISVLL